LEWRLTIKYWEDSLYSRAFCRAVFLAQCYTYYTRRTCQAREDWQWAHSLEDTAIMAVHVYPIIALEKLQEYLILFEEWVWK
jgi:hypothetical protein